MTLDIQAHREGDTTEITIAAQYSDCCGTDCCNEVVEVDATKSDEEIKTMVREKYAAAATKGEGCGCGPSCCSADFTMIGDEYADVEGYVAEADLGLGCGLPTEHAALGAGQTVLDLGAGAGIDAFVAREIVGEAGEVLGVDFTPEMVALARKNAAKLGYSNVHFYWGDIEDLPLPEARVDVVVSNCVLNLVPNKPGAFAEMYRVLRLGGHFCVSDIVVRGTLPAVVRSSVELYAGCVAGAIEEQDYLSALEGVGFTEVRVVKEKPIDVPDEVLLDVLSPVEVHAFRSSGGAIVSVTVCGNKG